jgi:phosphoribosylformylglycinamidine synthase
LLTFFNTLQDLLRDGLVLAYHDRADGGLLATLAEMMFASRTGVSIALDGLTASHDHAAVMAALFNEELGAVLQVAQDQTATVLARFAAAGLRHAPVVLGSLNTQDRLVLQHGGTTLLDEARTDLLAAWAETSHQLQRLRDNPAVPIANSPSCSTRRPVCLLKQPLTWQKTLPRRLLPPVRVLVWRCCVNKG